MPKLDFAAAGVDRQSQALKLVPGNCKSLSWILLLLALTGRHKYWDWCQEEQLQKTKLDFAAAGVDRQSQALGLVPRRATAKA